MIQQVFIIDDDPVSIRLSEFILSHTHFASRILTFLDPRKALDTLTSNLSGDLPEYLFLDLNMPFLDGWQFLDQLEPYALDLQDRMRVYILTSSVAPEDKIRARRYPLVVGFLEKPLDEGQLKLLHLADK
jgi:two-component system, chemotaxis family, chemotaxis protein CheY